MFSNEYLITINDHKNNKNYSKLIDCLRPQNDNQNAFICITKFQASVLSGVATVPNNVVVFLENTQNANANDPYSSIVVPSPVIDSFSTVTFINDVLTANKRAIYNYENNQQTWIKINRSSLSNLKFSFKTCSQYVLNATGSNAPVSYEDLPNFPFTLQFKIKFE